MSKLQIGLLIAVELILAAVAILFWGSIASGICIVLFFLFLLFMLIRNFAPFLKGRDYGGINKKYDELDPVNLFYEKHLNTTGLESQDSNEGD